MTALPAGHLLDPHDIPAVELVRGGRAGWDHVRSRRHANLAVSVRLEAAWELPRRLFDGARDERRELLRRLEVLARVVEKPPLAGREAQRDIHRI